MSDLDHTLSALADPTRRGAVDLLRHGPLRASELARALAASRPAMSRHLKVLRASGLVELAPEDPSDARARSYRLRRQPFSELGTWLEEVETFWGGQLAAFKQHAEKKHRKSRR